MHLAYKNDMSTQFRWEYYSAEIVKVCHEICKGKTIAEERGKRNFFYQVMDGHWNESRERFQFGPHPQGFLWDAKGKLIADQQKEMLQMTDEDLTICNALNMEESEWRLIFKSSIVDYLLEEHGLATLCVLCQMRNLASWKQYLEQMIPLEEHGLLNVNSLLVMGQKVAQRVVLVHEGTKVDQVAQHAM